MLKDVLVYFCNMRLNLTKVTNTKNTFQSRMDIASQVTY